ncbi:DUF2232 domain-containing protein [Desulfosoma caldarium]|uniref:Putative membrane protein DUF2232 n=1 Tax=Desulfosoma caldarium TaxID=610254 RepID=A0A3N1UR11_9BACT|nr:DUF2232 domain-containing protein [Desulfosoma caldarium]ROQ90987.1 putative membrane protein DUF2232 [Desulfosoma caldarium]
MSASMPQGHGTEPDSTRTVMREFAAGIGLSVAVFLLLILLPVTGIMATVIVPVPSLISIYRWGTPLGYFVPGGSAVVGGTLSLLLKTPQSLVYFIELLLLGTLLGSGMRKGWSMTRTVADAVVKVCAFGAVVFWWMHGHAEGGLWHHLEEQLRAILASVWSQTASEGTQDADLLTPWQAWIPILARLFPGVAVASTIIGAWLTLSVARRMLLLRGVLMPHWPAWSLWSAPEGLVWAPIAAGFLLLVSSFSLKLLGANVLIALGAVYLLQGVAITAFYFQKWHVPRLLQAFSYALIFFQQFVGLAVALMGFFDTWIDFRRLKKKADVLSSP